MKLAQLELENYKTQNITSIASTVVNQVTSDIPKQTNKVALSTSSLIFSTAKKPSI